MLPYYVLVASPFVATILQYLFRKRYNIKSERKNLAIAIFFLIYFLLVALRHETIGSDTWNYARIYNAISEVSWKTVLVYFKDSDPGFYLLSKLFTVFFDNVRIFFVVVAFVSIYPIAKFYYKESENSLLTIAMFLIFPIFMMNFSGIRQGIAIALGVFAFEATKEKNLKKFLIIVILATLFHASAIILLLIYPFYRLKIERKHLYIFIPIFAVFFMFNNRIYSLLIPLFGEKYGDRYGEIMETGAYSILILLVLFVAYAFFAAKLDLIDETTNGLRNMLLIATILQVFVPVNQVVMRINYYFLIFVPVLIPKITNKWKKAGKEYRWLINTVMYLFFLWYYFDNTVAKDSLNIYPYMFFWEA